MRKNNKKLLNSIAILLLVAMIALALISGTYAKYTTSATGSDTARVARWGFNSVNLTAIDLFDTTYGDTVSSTVNVIAPGTTKSATLTFSPEASAAPEVDYSFDVDVTLDNGTDDGAVDANLLAKLEFSLDGGTNFTDFDTFQAAVQALSEDHVEAGNLPGESSTYTIAWRWAFEVEDDTTTDGTDEATDWDTSDTALGNAATLANVRLVFSVGATQID